VGFAWGIAPIFTRGVFGGDRSKDGGAPEFTYRLEKPKLRAKDTEKENAMNAFETVFTLFLLRLVLPFGALLLLGEWIRSREPRRFGM
jgi:hypothetical protein